MYVFLSMYVAERNREDEFSKDYVNLPSSLSQHSYLSLAQAHLWVSVSFFSLAVVFVLRSQLYFHDSDSMSDV